MNYNDVFKLRTELVNLIEDKESYIPYMVTVTFNKYPFKYDNRLNNLFNLIRCDEDYNPDKHRVFMMHRKAKSEAMAFGSYGIKITENDIAKVLKQYDILMGHMVPGLIKNHNRSSKIHLHPITFDFIDIRGTRHNNPVIDEDDALHIHGIWLIHKNIQKPFDDLIEKSFYPILIHPSLTGIRDMHAQKVYNLTGAVNYCSKAMELPQGYIADRALLYHQYPITASERSSKKEFALEKYGKGIRKC